MKYCNQCGKPVNDDIKFCPSCGGAVGQIANTGLPSNQNYATPAQASSNDATMGLLAYIGILVLVPIFAAKDSKFARFHANQGLVLAIVEVAYGILIAILSSIFLTINIRLWLTLSTIFSLVWLVFLALSIIGITNAVKGRQRPLPVIGGITILK